jgi:hypothetical protein
MTTTTIIPAEGQVTDLLDSPMTASEKARRIEIEATCSGQTLARAKGLLSIYQDRLFRGDNGGCTWGEYLKNDACRLGYSELDTTNASNELNWCVLCIAIDKWNAENPSKYLEYPRTRNYMRGWTTLFDRKSEKGGGISYLPFVADEPAAVALKVWKTACFKSGDVPTLSQSLSIGAAARDQGLGRVSRSGEGRGDFSLMHKDRIKDNSHNGFDPNEQEPVDRVIDPEVLRQAEDARAAREHAKADPRDIKPLQKHDPIPMNEAETYCNMMGRLQMEAQQLRVWVEGRLNLYGTDGLNALRNGIDLGIYSVSDDVERITAIRKDLENVLDLLTDHIEPGELSPNSYNAEPSA